MIVELSQLTMQNSRFITDTYLSLFFFILSHGTPQEHLNNYYLITSVGYTVSLIALLVAFFIFTLIK